MKKYITRHFVAMLTNAVLISLLAAGTVRAANDTWTGGGGDNFWNTPGNWGGTPPSANDSLFFTGTTRLVNSNNITAGTAFGNISFTSPAGAFTLWGNSISLSGNITN